jgi:hypothetical protein
MKVRDLIEALAKANPEAEVLTWAGDKNGPCDDPTGIDIHSVEWASPDIDATRAEEGLPPQPVLINLDLTYWGAHITEGSDLDVKKLIEGVRAVGIKAVDLTDIDDDEIKY